MLEMISVSLLDLRSQMNISYEEAGAAVGTRAIGLFFGAVAGGFIHEVSGKIDSLYLHNFCMDPSDKSHNTSDKYPTKHHFVTEMCTYVLISVMKWCIVGFVQQVQSIRVCHRDAHYWDYYQDVIAWSEITQTNLMIERYYTPHPACYRIPCGLRGKNFITASIQSSNSVSDLL